MENHEPGADSWLSEHLDGNPEYLAARHADGLASNWMDNWDHLANLWDDLVDLDGNVVRDPEDVDAANMDAAGGPTQTLGTTEVRTAWPQNALDAGESDEQEVMRASMPGVLGVLPGDGGARDRWLRKAEDENPTQNPADTSAAQSTTDGPLEVTSPGEGTVIDVPTASATALPAEKSALSATGAESAVIEPRLHSAAAQDGSLPVLGVSTPGDTLSAVHAPRFPQFFSHRQMRDEYLRRADEYGRAAARTLSHGASVNEAPQAALQRLVDWTDAHHRGTDRERDLVDALLPNQAITRSDGAQSRSTGVRRTLKSAVRAITPRSSFIHVQTRDALKNGGFDWQLEMFRAGAEWYASQYPEVAPTGVRSRGDVWDAEMRDRGYRAYADLSRDQLAAAKDVELMLNVYQDLGASEGDLFTFRDALAYEYVPAPSDLPWEWFLDASHRAGVWDRQVEPDPWLTDLSRVHGWIHGVLAPRSRLPKRWPADGPTRVVLDQVPHVAMFEETTAPLLSAEVTGQGNWINPLSFKSLPLQMLTTGDRPHGLSAARQQAWSDMLRNQGILESLPDLKRGHAMALTLASGPDSIFYRPNLTLDEFRRDARWVGEHTEPADRNRWPRVLLRDQGVRAVIDRGGSAAEAMAAVEAFADTADDSLLAQIRGQASMALEAIQLLQATPTDSGSMYLVKIVPGPLFSREKLYAVKGREETFPGIVTKWTSSREVALATLDALARQTPPNAGHPLLVELEKPVSLRQTGFFSPSPEEFSAQHPMPLRVRFDGQGYGRDEKRDRWYSHLRVSELPPILPRYPWDNEILMRDVRSEEGVFLGFETHNAPDAAIREGKFGTIALTASNYRIVTIDASGTRHLSEQKNWSAPFGIDDVTGQPGMVFYMAHGTRRSARAIGPFGPLAPSGSQLGRNLAQRLEREGLHDKTEVLWWLCSVGASAAGLKTPAQLGSEQLQRPVHAANTVVKTFEERGSKLLAPSWGALPESELKILKFRPSPPSSTDVRANTIDPYFAGQSHHHRFFGTSWGPIVERYEAALGARLTGDPAATALIKAAVVALAHSGMQVGIDPHRPDVTSQKLLVPIVSAAQTKYASKPFVATSDLLKQRRLLQQHGLRVPLGKVPDTRGVYWLYRDLDLPAQNFPTFVKAVFGWGLANGHTVATLVADLYASGMSANQAALAAALAGNGTQMYGLIDMMFAPREGLTDARADLLRPPHWQLYAKNTQWLNTLTESALLAQLQGVEPAHANALLLLANDADRALLEATPAELPYLLAESVGQAMRGNPLDLPFLLRQDKVIRTYATWAARQTNRDTPTFDEARLAMLERAEQMVPVLRAQLVMHRAMSAEALTEQPSAGVGYLALAVPADLDTVDLIRLDAAQFASVQPNLADALAELGEAPAGTRPLLVRIGQSSAGRIPTAAGPVRFRYPVATELRVTSHARLTASDGTEHELLDAVEAPSGDREAAYEGVRAAAQATEENHGVELNTSTRRPLQQPTGGPWTALAAGSGMVDQASVSSQTPHKGDPSEAAPVLSQAYDATYTRYAGAPHEWLGGPPVASVSMAGGLLSAEALVSDAPTVSPTTAERAEVPERDGLPTPDRGQLTVQGQTMAVPVGFREQPPAWGTAAYGTSPEQEQLRSRGVQAPRPQNAGTAGAGEEEHL
ncbi:hypothetical protein, partial [Streptomyces sp. NPDC048663]|uniref:hypothetical protein n=1 Tax=Streptomyces sp. NPDC048663 TaxID=3155638 RepID=UPI00341216F1